MRKNKIVIMIIIFLLVCIIIIPSSKAIYRETKEKRINMTVTKPSYIIRYNNNGGSGSLADQTIKYGVTENLRTNTFTKTGYKFIGWNTQADGQGTSYTDSHSVSNLSSTNGDIITLYAQWMRVMAENVEYHEDEVSCSDTQCMIDELYYMLY